MEPGPFNRVSTKTESKFYLSGFSLPFQLYEAFRGVGVSQIVF